MAYAESMGAETFDLPPPPVTYVRFLRRARLLGAALNAVALARELGIERAASRGPALLRFETFGDNESRPLTEIASATQL